MYFEGGEEERSKERTPLAPNLSCSLKSERRCAHHGAVRRRGGRLNSSVVLGVVARSRPIIRSAAVRPGCAAARLLTMADGCWCARLGGGGGEGTAALFRHNCRGVAAGTGSGAQGQARSGRRPARSTLSRAAASHQHHNDCCFFAHPLRHDALRARALQCGRAPLLAQPPHHASWC